MKIRVECDNTSRHRVPKPAVVAVFERRTLTEEDRVFQFLDVGEPLDKAALDAGRPSWVLLDPILSPKARRHSQAIYSEAEAQEGEKRWPALLEAYIDRREHISPRRWARVNRRSTEGPRVDMNGRPVDDDAGERRELSSVTVTMECRFCRSRFSGGAEFLTTVLDGLAGSDHGRVTLATLRRLDVR